jgi:hypothetical protein
LIGLKPELKSAQNNSQKLYFKEKRIMGVAWEKFS